MKIVSLGKEMLRIQKYGSRPPTRSLWELADEFGVTTRQLAKALREDAGAPKPTHKSRDPRGHDVVWYVHCDARRWWRERTRAIKNDADPVSGG